MSSEVVEGLTVRACDGAAVGVVAGVFAHGPLAGRLRVEGVYAHGRYALGPRAGTAVFAIPRRAVVRQRRDSLVLGVSLQQARHRWLMHVREPQRVC